MLNSISCQPLCAPADADAADAADADADVTAADIGLACPDISLLL